MAKTRKVERRVLPSGLITYRAPYIDAAGKRRSKNFRRRSDAEAFLLSGASELVHGVHSPLTWIYDGVDALLIQALISQCQAASRTSRISSRTRLNSGFGARHMVL
jgi:hypothetical protein